MKDSDERYTPQHILAVVREFSPIGFDPCTTRDNPTGAISYCYRPHHDGLVVDWCLDCHGGGRLTWVNHPYSAGEPMKWADKMAQEAVRGCEIISLGAADTSTKAMQFLLDHADAVAFWRKRICFLRPDGAYEQGAKFANASFYFGERAGRFRRVFSPHASVLVLR